jgi:sulfane dehydrogenase subunit SoxC
MRPVKTMPGSPKITSEGVTYLDLEAPPAELLQQLGKDERLVPYGGGNFGMPLEMIDPASERIVPNERFFMRSNGPVPVINPESWQLTITGLVDSPRSLSLDDLLQFPSQRIEAFLECAGNGRTRFDPVPPGTPWRNDAVGNAVWEGVALRDVLLAASIQPGAVDVVTQGGDFPEMRRGLPLSVALAPGVLIATRMNGEPLPVAHGGPARLIVPGWAGIASTKWLAGIEVIDHPFAGFWNADNYVLWDDSGAPLRPVAEMPPKSVIATPLDGAKLQSGPVKIAGWAWSGFGAIQLVEVSVDGGQSWRFADLHDGVRTGWRRWELMWEAPPGKHLLLARATDERRLRQPDQALWNAKGYQMNAVHRIAVEVRD